MCKQTVVLDAHPAIVRPPLLPLPPGHLDLANAALCSPAADSQKSLPYKTLWCWTTASTIFCVASALHCEWPPWMTSGLLPAVPQLSALASRFTLRQFAVQHLLCPLLVFRLFLPVTDSDKLTKAHETKKRVWLCAVTTGCQKAAPALRALLAGGLDRPPAADSSCLMLALWPPLPPALPE